MIRSLAALIGCTAILLVHADAQIRPIYDTGAAGLVQLLQRLQTTASVLHTGAHPDDEDSAFLARAARGDHARVAYLSLNRGEGGQNIIGNELFDALGVIRTEELLQARRLDGGEQFFTRTFDFGFSKRRDEAAMRWNERDGPRRHGARDSHVPAARDQFEVGRDIRRRSRSSPACRISDSARVQSGGRSERISRAASGRAACVADAQAV